MTIAEIQSMIAKGETRTLELKKSTGDLKDGMHSACAFLNTDGGWLIFGVTPNSLKIIGQQVNDSTRQEIANALAGLEPVVNVMVEYVDVPDAKNDEQAKVRLCKLMMDKTNWLIFDEPTNHLDVDAKEELKRAMKEFKGTIVLVSHEPEFYDGLATKIWNVQDWFTTRETKELEEYK